MTEFEQAVADAEERWNSTYLAGDVSAFGRLLDEEFVYLSERGEFRRDEYLSNLASGIIEMRALKTVSSRMRVFGDIVIVIGEVRMEASFQGTDISGADRYTRVWRVLADGDVRAVSQHANAVASAGQ